MLFYHACDKTTIEGFSLATQKSPNSTLWYFNLSFCKNCGGSELMPAFGWAYNLIDNNLWISL